MGVEKNMKCSFCGSELEPGSGFCPNCGTMMSVDNAETAENAAEPQKYEPDRADVYSDSVRDEEPAETTPLEEDYSGQTVPLNEFNAPEYIPHNLEDDPDNFKSVSKNEVEDDPFSELHPDDSSSSGGSDFGDDMYIKPSGGGKKNSIVVALLVIVLAAVVVGGVAAARGTSGGILDIFKKAPTSESDVSTTADEKTTEGKTEKTTEKATTDKTTEKETKETKETKDSTTEKTTEKTTTKVAETTKKEETTAKPATTTKPAASSTAPASTKPATSAPSTEKPTERTTAAPATTESLKKPAKYFSESFTRYATEDGVSLRKGPSASSARIIALSVGNEVKVYGEENGFYYVYNSRYGYYGWVNKAYLAKERPVSDKDINVSGVVSPDKKYSNPETKTVTASEGLRLRKGPGSSYDTIRYIGKGYSVRVIGTSTENAGWVYVKDLTHGIYGWVSAAYIK